MIICEIEAFAEAHDLQDSEYRALRGHQYESSTARLNGVLRMHQRLRAGRVHERQAAEIEAKIPTLPVEPGINDAFELRSGRDVQLAGDMKGVDCPVRFESEAQETIHRVDPRCPSPTALNHPECAVDADMAASTRTATAVGDPPTT